MTRLASRCAALGLLLTTPACTTMEWEAMAVGLAQGFASADYGQNSCAPGYMWQSSYDSLGNPVSWCEPASYYTLPADLPPGWEAGIDRGGHRHDHDRENGRGGSHGHGHRDRHRHDHGSRDDGDRGH